MRNKQTAKLALGAYEQYARVLSEERWKSYRDTLSASVYGDGPEARIVAEWNQEMVGSVWGAEFLHLYTSDMMVSIFLQGSTGSPETFKFLSQSRQRI